MTPHSHALAELQATFRDGAVIALPFSERDEVFLFTVKQNNRETTLAWDRTTESVKALEMENV